MVKRKTGLQTTLTQAEIDARLRDVVLIMRELDRACAEFNAIARDSFMYGSRVVDGNCRVVPDDLPQLTEPIGAKNEPN